MTYDNKVQKQEYCVHSPFVPKFSYMQMEKPNSGINHLQR